VPKALPALAAFAPFRRPAASHPARSRGTLARKGPLVASAHLRGPAAAHYAPDRGTLLDRATGTPSARCFLPVSEGLPVPTDLGGEVRCWIVPKALQRSFLLLPTNGSLNPPLRRRSLARRQPCLAGAPRAQPLPARRRPQSCFEGMPLGSRKGREPQATLPTGCRSGVRAEVRLTPSLCKHGFFFLTPVLKAPRCRTGAAWARKKRERHAIARRFFL
jgi:hypothetical protein